MPAWEEPPVTAKGQAKRRRRRRFWRGILLASVWFGVVILVVWLLLGPLRLIFRLLSWLW